MIFVSDQLAKLFYFN